MATNRARQIATVAALVVTSSLTLGLTACKSSGTASSSGTTAGTTPATTSGTTAASTPTTTPTTVAAQGKLDGVPAACPSADEVMSNLHLSALVVSGNDPSICQYLFNGDKTAPHAVITFNAAPGITPAAVEAGLKQEQSNVKPVSGLADAAFSFTSEGPGLGLTFLSGTTICSIATTVPTTTADEVALAQAILQG